MKEKKLSNAFACFKLRCYILTWTVIKTSTDFVRVNIYLKLNSYEDN